MPAILTMIIVMFLAIILVIIFAKALRFFLTIILCILVAIAIFAFFVVMDLREITTTTTEPILYLLISHGTPLVATVAGQNQSQLSLLQWTSLRDGYPKNLNKLPYNKIVSIDASLLSMLDETPVVLPNKQIPFDVAVAIISINDPLPLLVAHELLLPINFSPPSTLSREEQGIVYQQAIFNALLRDNLMRNPKVYYAGFKAKNITIYPQSAWFVFLKIMPKSLLTKGVPFIPYV